MKRPVFKYAEPRTELISSIVVVIIAVLAVEQSREYWPGAINPFFKIKEGREIIAFNWRTARILPEQSPGNRHYRPFPLKQGLKNTISNLGQGISAYFADMNETLKVI